MKKKLYAVMGLMMGLWMASTTVSAQNWFSDNTVTASKKTVTRNVKLHSFSEIQLIGCGDVDLKVVPAGTAPSAMLTMPENIQDIVQVYVKDDVLYFRLKKGYNVRLSNTTLKLDLHAPMVKSLTITGSGDAKILNEAVVDHDVELRITGSGDIETQRIACDRFTLSIAGSGDVDLTAVQAKSVNLSISGSGDIDVNQVDARELEARIAGSGDIELKGKADTATYRIAGSGDLKAHNVQARMADAQVSGSGDLSCYASESLTARTSGVGEIRYKGNPQRVEASKRGVSKM
jgi:hypothetical protein